MRIKLFGKKHVRDFRAVFNSQCLVIAGDDAQKINEQTVMEVMNNMLDQIQDLEMFICEGAGLDYHDDETVGEPLDTQDVHFPPEMFEA